MGKGKLILVVGVSGSGKDSLINCYKSYDSSCQKLVTYTTREPRKGEINGVDYNFVSIEEFNKIKDDGDTILSKEIHDNWYAPTFSGVEKIINSGDTCFFTINLPAIPEFLDSYPDAKVVYIAPPNLEVLRNRLSQRGTETSETMERRMNDAKAELYTIHDSEHVDRIIYNHDLYESGKEFMDYVDHL